MLGGVTERWLVKSFIFKLDNKIFSQFSQLATIWGFLAMRGATLKMYHRSVVRKTLASTAIICCFLSDLLFYCEKAIQFWYNNCCCRIHANSWAEAGLSVTSSSTCPPPWLLRALSCRFLQLVTTERMRIGYVILKLTGARQDGCARCQNRKVGSAAALQGYSLFILCIIHKNYFMAKKVNSYCWSDWKSLWLSPLAIYSYMF